MLATYQGFFHEGDGADSAFYYGISLTSCILASLGRSSRLRTDVEEHILYAFQFEHFQSFMRLLPSDSAFTEIRQRHLRGCGE